MYISGETEDGKQIVSGFFKLVDGQGIPLTMVLDHLKKNDLVPNWINFLQDTIDCKWNLKSTLIKIDQSCFDTYGIEHRDIVMKKIKTWITINT